MTTINKTSEIDIPHDPPLFADTGTSPLRSSPGSSLQRKAKKFAAQEWAPSALLVLLDVVTWLLLYGSASYIRQDAFYSGPFEFVLIEVIQLAVIIQALFVIGGYARRTDMWGLNYTAEHILASLFALLASSLLIYVAATFTVAMKPSRSVILSSFILFTPISLLYRRIVYRVVASSTAQKAFLVVGAGEAAQEFYRAYRQSANRQRLEFVDITGEKAGRNIAGPGSPIVGGELADRLKGLGTTYSGVILAEQVGNLPSPLMERLVRTQFQSVRVYTLESFYETHWRSVPVQAIDPFWPLQMGFQLAAASPYHYLKRLSDVAAATVGLIIFAPLMLAMAIAIWLTSGRPILFRQSRLGRDEEPFEVIKFRTMVTADQDNAADIYTRDDDPRILRGGRLLRKFRLDELPQLWNVLRGEMSLIGPRAEWDRCAERYNQVIPFYQFRHLVKPGITGWAQVNYPYGESDKDALEKLKYDLYYIRHYSLKLDAMIALKTIHVMLFSKGR